MFPKSKYSRSNTSTLNYKPNLVISNQSSKYYPNIYSKKKSTLNKKFSNNKFGQSHTWKKQYSHNNWNKENDKNSLNNGQYNIKNDTNEYIPKEKRDNKNCYNKEYSSLYSHEKNEFTSKPKNPKKDEKKISFDYGTTTTQSNSSSHEDSNNTNDNNINLTAPNDNYNSNESQTLNIDEEYKTIYNNNNNNNVTDLINLNLNLNSPIPDSTNFNSNIIININNFQIPNDNNNLKISMPMIPTTPQIQTKKNKKQKKNKKICYSSKELNIKKSISANIGNIDNDFQLSNEPFNKFNSVNNELVAPLINPIVENTEILKVNVKIAKDKNVIFKLRRFDDLFLTVKFFCEINSIEEKLIKPIIIKALCTLNSIYQIYNTQLDSKNIKILKMLETFNNKTSI